MIWNRLKNVQIISVIFLLGLFLGFPYWTSADFQPSTIAPPSISPPAFPTTSSKNPAGGSSTTGLPPSSTANPNQPGATAAQTPGNFPSYGQPVRPEIMGNVFTSPGIATNQGGQWLGSEHLYNLTPNIGIYPEIVMAPGLPIPITEGSIKEKLMPILRTGGIIPRTLSAGGTPLPFLHVLIMITPIDKGYVAYCALRLFEEIQNKRVFLPSDVVWQAITWEKQELVTASSEQIMQEIEKTLSNFALSFAERYRMKQPENPGQLR